MIMRLAYLVLLFSGFHTDVACSQISKHSEFLQLARVYFKNGQFGNSTQCYVSALQTVQPGEEQDRALILRQLADVYASLDEISRAERLYSESPEIYKRKRDHLNMVILMRSVGLAYSIEYRERDAIRVLKRALSLARELPGPRIDLISGLLDDLGIAHYREGRLSEADKYFEEAADLISATGLPLNDELLNTRGAVLLVQGQYVKAEDLLKQALNRRRVTLGQSNPGMRPANWRISVTS